MTHFLSVDYSGDGFLSGFSKLHTGPQRPWKSLNKSTGLWHGKGEAVDTSRGVSRDGSAYLCRSGIPGQEPQELFLDRMDGLIPWPRLEGRIRPFYPKTGKGRHPYPLAVMLRIHCVQLFYNLSDPGMEDVLYESEPVRRFVGLKLSGALPDETTILNFCHLLERHNLGQGLFEEINGHLESQGLRLREGTIEAPAPTKNRAGERDPQMHQTKKGNQWHCRDAGAHRGGCGDELGAQHDHHGGQRP